MQNQEINLRDYTNVIVKRKNIIIAVFAATVLVAVVVNLLMPRIYKISMIIEPGVLSVTEKGDWTYFDSPKNIEVKLEEDVFNTKIMKALNLDLQETDMEFQISQPRETNLVKISIEEEKKNIDLGMEILDQLFIELSNSYKDISEYETKKIENEISSLLNQIQGQKNILESEREKLKILDAKEAEILSELKNFKGEAKVAVSQGSGPSAGKIKIQDNPVASLLYFNHLNNQLIEVSGAKENAEFKIAQTETSIYRNEIEIEKLNLEKDKICDIKLVKAPEASKLPVRPKRRQNVIFAGIISLTFGLFLAFFMEYWEKIEPKK